MRAFSFQIFVKRLLSLGLFVFCAATVHLLSQSVWADWRVEQRKVEFLFKKMEESRATFIRNDKEYTAQEAIAHLRKKLRSAQNSFFAPSREKWTAEMFIAKIASKSSTTGKKYYLKFSNGTKVESETWLREQLKLYNE